MRFLLLRLQSLPFSTLAIIIVLLCIPAYLINLHLTAFIGDEAIRALVAYEMDLSGNYIATTMHGASYINKPPLFNWILLFFFKICGAYTELPPRLATVFFLGMYAVLVYRMLHRQFDFDFAFLAALMTITSGRFLFYDAMLGLIDTTFSVVIYALFMSIYFYGLRAQWGRLFAVSYGLMAIGFLLKGLPAIVFQGLSLLAGLWFHGQLRRLISWQHVAGMALGGAILGVYLWVYSWYRPLEVFLPNLLQESVKRTVVEHGWWPTIVKTARFPVDSIYHFLPYSLLLVFWADRHFIQKIRANGFVWFNFLMLAVNLPIYWTARDVMPRYLLMFIPLFNVVGLYLLEQNRQRSSWRHWAFYYTLGVLMALAPVFFAPLPFLDRVNELPLIPWLAPVLALVSMLLLNLYFNNQARSLWWFLMALLLIRIGFDLVVLPIRSADEPLRKTKAEVYAFADAYRDKGIYVYGISDIREPVSFYLTERLGHIVPRSTDTSLNNAVYLVNHRQHPDVKPGVCIDTLYTDYPSITLYLYAR